MLRGSSLLRVHACYRLREINRLRNPSEKSHLGQEVLESIVKDPYQAKAATGKEAALAIHSLGEFPLCTRESRIFCETAEAFTSRVNKILLSSMSEKSVAIAAVGISRLNGVISSGDVSIFVGLVDRSMTSGRTVSFPRNLANIAYSVAHMENCPLTLRAKSLNGWISRAVISLASSLQVPDIVQLVSAYSFCSIRNREVLSALEAAAMSQVQYMDSRSLSAIMSGLSVLGHIPSQNFSSTFLATLSQCVATLNAQSFCSSLFGLSFWASSGLTLDKHAVESVLRKFEDLFESIPSRSMCVALKAVVRLADNLDMRFIENRMNDAFFARFKGGEPTWIVADVADSLSRILQPKAVRPFIQELITPILEQNSEIEIRDLLKLISVHANVTGESHFVSHYLGEMRRKGGPARVFSFLREMDNPSLIKQIVKLFHDSNWIQNLDSNSLMDLAKIDWATFGDINEVIASAILSRNDNLFDKPFLEWVRVPTVNIPESSRLISLTTGKRHDLVPSGKFKPPHLGSREEVVKESELCLLKEMMDAVDPFFRLQNPGLHFFFSEREPNHAQISSACMLMQPHMVGVFMSLPITQEKVYSLLRTLAPS